MNIGLLFDPSPPSNHPLNMFKIQRNSKNKWAWILSYCFGPTPSSPAGPSPYYYITITQHSSVPAFFKFLVIWSSGERWVFTQDKQRKIRKNLIFYLINELSTDLCTYISLSIGLPSLIIFHSSSKMSCEKGLAVKSQIFILSMSTPLPNVKQLEIRKEKTAISDPWYSDRFWSGLPVWSSKNPWKFIKKSLQKTFFTYKVIYEKKWDILW